MPRQNLLCVESHDFPLASSTTSAYRLYDCVAWKENIVSTKECILESLMPKQLVGWFLKLKAFSASLAIFL